MISTNKSLWTQVINIPKRTPRAVELMSGKTNTNQPKRQTVFGFEKQTRTGKKRNKRTIILS